MFTFVSDKKQTIMHNVVKQEFSKFGFSTEVMETISKMVTDEAGAEATDEVIKEKLKIYEPLAKTFQSEIDARVTKAKQTATSTQQQPTQEQGESGAGEQSANPNPTEEVPAWAKAMMSKLDAFEKKEIVTQKNEITRTKLKELKMTDAEINAVMYGREFKDDNEIDTFVTQQGEFFKDILSTRVSEQLGDGNPPAPSQGATDLESFKKDLEKFNKIK